MFFLFLLLLCTFAFLYMVTRRDVFLFFCIFFFFTFCTQVFLYMVRAKFVPFSSCILVFLYFELTFFFTLVFLYFCTYIDRVTRHKRGLFTSQDVIFPQPRCTQSCSGIPPFMEIQVHTTFQKQSSGHTESVIRRSQSVSVMRLYPNTAKNVHFFWWLCKSDGKHSPAGQFDKLVQFECKT